MPMVPAAAPPMPTFYRDPLFEFMDSTPFTLDSFVRESPGYFTAILPCMPAS
jgi:hypothetical protein